MEAEKLLNLKEMHKSQNPAFHPFTFWTRSSQITLLHRAGQTMLLHCTLLDIMLTTQLKHSPLYLEINT